MVFPETSRLFIAFVMFSCFFACKEKQVQPVVKNLEPMIDSMSLTKSREYRQSYSTIEVKVAQVDSSFSTDFMEFIQIAQGLNYSVSGAIKQTDSLDFHCWKFDNQGRLSERLIYRGIRTHTVSLKEITKDRMKKGMFLEEAIFPSPQEAQHAAKKIRAFIYQDSTTNAYDKRPTDIFRYQNRVYKLSVGSFMSIPAMKTACRKFRKKLGPAAAAIMLWDYFGYGE
jgi:hypothetical protein